MGYSARYDGVDESRQTNGVNVSAENLCPLHWQFAHGQRDYVLPVVIEP